MAKIRETGIAIMLTYNSLIWIVGRIANSTLMIVPLPYSGSYFIECINTTFSSAFDQAASRLSDAMLFAFIVATLMIIPYKWIRSTIFGLYVLVIALFGYHALMSLATYIKLLIDPPRGHCLASCTLHMSLIGSLIAFFFHTFVALNIPSLIQAIDIKMNPTTKKGTETRATKKGTGPQVAKKEQKAAEENIEMV